MSQAQSPVGGAFAVDERVPSDLVRLGGHDPVFRHAGELGGSSLLHYIPGPRSTVTGPKGRRDAVVYALRGGVSERPKEHASKACEVQASQGSNPCATANRQPVAAKTSARERLAAMRSAFV